ncbi:hypothetical protein BC830DRAFT_1089419 [Chytriomyces sp. MP71]|nr:hypothetical protein BC830DRAFT_1089419 [Chytriomyces sp. MP71]
MQLQPLHDHPVAHFPDAYRSDETALRFRRRILHPRRVAKWEQGTQGFRMFKMGSYAFLAGCSIYMALFADFGTSEHCFTPIRKQYDVVRSRVLSLSDADEKELLWRKSKQ